MNGFIRVELFDCKEVMEAAETVLDMAKKTWSRCGAYFKKYLILANPHDTVEQIVSDYNRWIASDPEFNPFKGRTAGI